jgi:hypothetical protein
MKVLMHHSQRAARSFVRGLEIRLNTVMYNFYRNKVRKLCKSARQSYYDKKILNTRESNPKKWYDNIKSISGLSKSKPFSSIFHDGEFKRGHKPATHESNLLS